MSSWPSRPPPASASGTRCWRRPSTRRSSRASARSCTRGSPTSCRAAERPEPAELAPHWAAAGRAREALVASVDAARQAEACLRAGGGPRAPRAGALTLWDAVPDAAALLQVDLAGLCSRAAELASRTGAAPRAVELAQRAIELVGDSDPQRAAGLYGSLGSLPARMWTDRRRPLRVRTRWSSSCRQSHPPRSAPPRWRRSARGADARPGASRSRSRSASRRSRWLARWAPPRWSSGRSRCLGRDLAYVGRGDEGLGYLWRALELAEESGDPLTLLDAYVSLTDVLTMLGRPEQSARVGARGLEAVRRYGIDSTVLLANSIEALLAIGEWEAADRASAAALRAITANFPYMLFILRADLEIGRGDVEAARGHLDAALDTLREDRGQGIYDLYLAELALWERRWTDADQAVRDGLARATSRHAAQMRVWFCAKGLRAQAELVALARARRDADAVRSWLDRAGTLIADARAAAEQAAAVTPNAGGWLALAEAEYARSCGLARPQSWSDAAAAWTRLERPPLAAYCRWRQAEALVAAGASRTDASAPLREAHAVADRLGARPLLRELELLAQRARLDLTPPQAATRDGQQGLQQMLGLTPREAEVLGLVARGYTDREIAAALVISAKTASVHVSHILRKLEAPNRLEAAAIAHRLAPPPDRQPAPDGGG